MDNSGFVVDVDKDCEKMFDPKVIDTTHAHNCQPDVCRSTYARYLKDQKKVATNPWDNLKTVFLVVIIAALILWLLLYVTISELGMV